MTGGLKKSGAIAEAAQLVANTDKTIDRDQKRADHIPMKSLLAALKLRDPIRQR